MPLAASADGFGELGGVDSGGAEFVQRNPINAAGIARCHERHAGDRMGWNAKRLRPGPRLPGLPEEAGRRRWNQRAGRHEPPFSRHGSDTTRRSARCRPAVRRRAAISMRIPGLCDPGDFACRVSGPVQRNFNDPALRASSNQPALPGSIHRFEGPEQLAHCGSGEFRQRWPATMQPSERVARPLRLRLATSRPKSISSRLVSGSDPIKADVNARPARDADASRRRAVFMDVNR